MAKPVEQLESVVIRFAGDSGDGMQLTGGRFTSETALSGNDLSTYPDFPAEIRAPAGSLPGVSGFQLHFADHDILTPGDQPDVLVAMNPAALKTNLRDVLEGRHRDRRHRRVHRRGTCRRPGYDVSPLEDGTLDGYQAHHVPLTSMTVGALKEIDGVTPREAERAKNMFALGLMSWLYGRPVESTLDFLETKFAKRPEIAEANIKAFKTGYAFGETSEAFSVQYEVKPAKLPPGLYRQITGNSALSYGLIAASKLSGLDLFLGAYPITPASSILEELARHKRFGVRTFQAEDEIAAVGAALGAAFGGAIGVTTSAGPGIVLKAETVGLAVTLELPLLIIDVQRAGPVDRHADEARAGRPADGALRPELRFAGAGARARRRRATASTRRSRRCAWRSPTARRCTCSATRISRTAPSRGASRTSRRSTPIHVEFASLNRAGRRRRVPAVQARPGDARAAVGDPRHAGARASDRRAREGERDRQRLVRPRQPRPDDAAARAEGRRDRGAGSRHQVVVVGVVRDVARFIRLLETADPMLEPRRARDRPRPRESRRVALVRRNSPHSLLRTRQ